MNIYEALFSASHLLTKFGGHAEAAGLTVPQEYFTSLGENLHAYMKQRRDLLEASPVREYDFEVQLPADRKIVEDLAVLEPFGCGNPYPVALIRNARLSGIRPCGGNAHASFEIQTENGVMRGIYFGHPADDVPPRADVLGELRISTFAARRGDVEMTVRDLSSETRAQAYLRKAVEALRRPESPRSPGLFFRDKKRLGVIYSAFAASAPPGTQTTLAELYTRSRGRVPDLSPEETAFAYAVFSELELIEGSPNGRIQIAENARKRALDESSIYRKCGGNVNRGPEG